MNIFTDFLKCRIFVVVAGKTAKLKSFIETSSLFSTLCLTNASKSSGFLRVIFEISIRFVKAWVIASPLLILIEILFFVLTSVLETNFWPEREHDITNAAFEIKEDISVFLIYFWSKKDSFTSTHNYPSCCQFYHFCCSFCFHCNWSSFVFSYEC